MSPFGDLGTRPSRRPVSPFVALLLGGAATALIAEWLRFQGAPAVAIVPGVVGSLATVASVVRLYRARRRWRRGEARFASVLTDGRLDDDPASVLTIREEDGRLAIVRAVAHDEAPSPLIARPADESAASRPRSALGGKRRDGTVREGTAGESADPPQRQASPIDH